MECSVIICTRDRSSQLERVLSSINELIIPPSLDWELIIVDNGSSDNTSQVVSSFQNRLQIRYVFEPKPGKSNALNRAIDIARGRYFIMADDDVLVSPMWLSAYCDAFSKWPEASIFAGKIVPVLEPPTPPWFQSAVGHLKDLLAHRDFGPLPVSLSVENEVLPFGANWAVSAVEQKKFRYDTNLGVAPGRRRGGEEIDVSSRILLSGKTGWWVPAAEVRHIIPTARQTYSYIIEYYESAGELAAYINHNVASKQSNIKAGLEALIKLPIRFVQAHFSRTRGDPNWVKYLTYYANKRGTLKFFFPRH